MTTESPDESVDVLIVLHNQFTARNYVVGGILAALADDGLKVAIVANNGSLDGLRTRCLESRLIALEPMLPGKWQGRFYQLLRLGSMVARNHKDEYREKLRILKNSGNIARHLVPLWEGLGKFLDLELFCEKAFRFIFPGPRASKLMSILRPRLVVWPTTISNSADFNVMKAAEKLGVPILMGEGSFDNLTTKGALWPRPQRIMVWGEYSKKLALSEHGFSESEIDVTGPPHFDVYGNAPSLPDRNAFCAAHGLDANKKLILFAGTTVSKFSEEAEVLQLMADWIKTGKIPPAEIFYRPHPREGKRVAADAIDKIDHVTIDYGIGSEKSGFQKSWTIDPEEALQRASVISACDIIVSAFSTVLVEGALLRKPSVIFGFVPAKAKGNVSVFPNMRFSHVQYLLQQPAIFAATDEAALLDALNSALGLIPEHDLESLWKCGASIAHCTDGNGAKRTRETILKALNDLAPPSQKIC